MSVRARIAKEWRQTQRRCRDRFAAYKFAHARRPEMCGMPLRNVVVVVRDRSPDGYTNRAANACAAAYRPSIPSARGTVAVVASASALAFTGSGRYSLDALLGLTSMSTTANAGITLGLAAPGAIAHLAARQSAVPSSVHASATSRDWPRADRCKLRGSCVSSIFVRRRVGVVFMRMYSNCAHYVRLAFNERENPYA